MPFTVSDYDDLIELIRQSPELRERVRTVLFDQAFLAMPDDIQHIKKVIAEIVEIQRQSVQILKGLSEAQQRTEETVRALTERVDRLEEAMRILTERVDRLAEAQQHTEEMLTALIEAHARLEQRVDTLAEEQREIRQEQQRIHQRLGKLTGMVLEINYERKAQARFGRLLYKSRVVEWNELEDLLAGNLTADELEMLAEVDLVVRGAWRRDPQRQIWLAVEISGKIDAWDVKRAAERAQLLRKAGLIALPVVAGEEIGREAEERARQQGVILLLDGSVRFVDEASRKHLA